MRSIIEKHAEDQEQKISYLNSELTKQMNKYTVLKSGPGVLKYQ